MREQKLLLYLKLYRQCTIEQQGKIFCITLKNNIRYLLNISTRVYDYYRKIYDLLSVNVTGFYQYCCENAIRSYKREINSIESIKKIYEECCRESEDVFVRSITFNATLVLNGICPIIFYAFNKWNYVNNKNDWYKILEFNVMSQYRTIEYHCPDKIMYFNELLSSEGAIFDTYLCRKKNLIYKIPKTLAAFNVLAEYEYITYKYYRNSKMNVYFPEKFSIIRKSKIIIHSYIEGKSGEFYLNKYMKLTALQIESLKKCIDSYFGMENKRYKLDIHPGNFVWDSKLNQWFLIDLGNVPEISSDNFIYDSFEEYYSNIWLNLLEKKRIEPIRSFDTSL